MAATPAEFEEMDREEIQQELARLETLLYKNLDARKDLEETVDELVDRVGALEEENCRLRARVDTADGKDEKVAKIVQFANNARGKEPAIKLTAKDIKGATGCSRRYAYDLMDDLPDEYDWFLRPQEMTQYGSLQIDNTDARRLGIDFEGVHSSGCPVNKFTTSDGGMGGAE